MTKTQGAAQAVNRQKQAQLRERRKASQVRMTIWTSRMLAEDFRRIAQQRQTTHAELFAAMIRAFRDERPGQSVIDS